MPFLRLWRVLRDVPVTWSTWPNSRRDTSSPTLTTLGCAATAMIERFHLRAWRCEAASWVLDVNWWPLALEPGKPLGAKVVTSFGAGNSQPDRLTFPVISTTWRTCNFCMASIWTPLACDESIIKYAHPANGMDMLHIASLLRMRMEKILWNVHKFHRNSFFRFTE